MKQTGEWGEFFPISISPFSYNETTAYDYFPLNQENVTTKLNGTWKENITQSLYHGQEVQPPEHIKDSDGITREIFTCTKC